MQNIFTKDKINGIISKQIKKRGEAKVNEKSKKDSVSAMQDNKKLSRIKFVSALIFLLSAVSPFIAYFIIEGITKASLLYTDNMWIFFLFIPISVLSLIWGLSLKKKGLKYINNLICGIVITAILVIFGFFTFVFRNVYADSVKPLLEVEQSLNIDIPTHVKIETTKLEDKIANGYVYYVSNVQFNYFKVSKFEKQIKEDENWLSEVPTYMLGISSPSFHLDNADYTLIYNKNTKEINTLPEKSGTYRFLCVMYDARKNNMEIVEYDINYVI